MRLGWVPLVVVTWGWLGAGAAIAQAPEEPETAEPIARPTGAVEETSASVPARVYQSLRSFGSFGANAGGMLFFADDDASKDALVRPSLNGVFRYRFSENWVGVGEFGFGWNAYRDQGDSVLAVMAGTIGLYRHVSNFLGLDWKAGAGGGFYRWNFKYNGKSRLDAETKLPLRAIDPGVFTGLEAERRMSRHVTLLATAQGHYIFSEDEDQFPVKLGGNDGFVSLKFGVNYHFSPYEGILWESVKKRVIRLESGKAGS